MWQKYLNHPANYWRHVIVFGSYNDVIFDRNQSHFGATRTTPLPMEWSIGMFYSGDATFFILFQ